MAARQFLLGQLPIPAPPPNGRQGISYRTPPSSAARSRVRNLDRFPDILSSRCSVIDTMSIG